MIRPLALVISVLVAGIPSASSSVWAADEPDEQMPGRVVVVKPSAGLFKFVAKAATTFDLPDATNDPTIEGASLEVFDTLNGGNLNAYSLPSTGWKGLGNPAGDQGYRYKGAGTVRDPCKAVLVRRAVVRAVCKGPGVTLTTPFDGEVLIVLTVGSDSKRYCAGFGGDDVKNDGTLTKRKNSPPAFCPIIDPFTTTTTSTSTTTSTTLPLMSTTTSTSTTVSHTGTITTTTTSLPVPCDQTHPFVCGQGFCAVGTCVLDGSNVCECQ